MSRHTISLNKIIQRRARDLIKWRGFDGLSDLFQDFVRSDWEARYPGPEKRREAGLPIKTPATAPLTPDQTADAAAVATGTPETAAARAKQIVQDKLSQLHGAHGGAGDPP